MKLTKKQLINEIKTLQEAARIHTKNSIKQYKKVLHTIKELQEEKKSLEKKIRQRTKKLEKIAKFDALTSLPNRYLFKEELMLTLQSAKLIRTNFALIFIDLDGFKDVNDIYGHESGDNILKIISKRLLLCVRKDTDLVARLGGDEFTVLLKGLAAKDKIEKIANKILAELSREIQISSKIKVIVSASLGIEIYHHFDNTSIEDLLAHADIAMYKAKAQGKNQVVFFNTTMKQELTKKVLLQDELREAYKKGEFIYYLHPIVGSNTKELCGAEVLLRWKKNGEILSPYFFMEELEMMDLFVPLTFEQIQSVVREFEDIKKELSLSFNLTARILDSMEIVKFLEELKKELNPHLKLYFEITESDFANNIVKAKKVLEAISALGFKISLDDFGTGYSSLSHIRAFPLDTLKIDKIFVDSIVESQKDYQLFKSIITMARILDIQIVVEGIETEEQFKKIRKKSYVKIQGYYFYKPMPLDEFRSIMSN
ncbi:EAL domain-containing protein [Sulfurimonas sp. NWX79]|uniref:putative bifunctional diguanylate cyclase/phosphodiesterase n=1 Tax=Sulfurimonas sp. NWX79 TaxID=2925412 RepID=UPI0032047B57